MKTRVRVTERFSIALVYCLFVGVSPNTVIADLNSTVKFDIAPQELASALIRYSEQSGVQVTSPAEIIEKESSTGVVGMFQARAALEKLLQGTDLGYDVIDPNTVGIRAISPSKKPRPAAETDASDVSFRDARSSSVRSHAREIDIWGRFRRPEASVRRSAELHKVRVGSVQRGSITWVTLPISRVLTSLDKVLSRGKRLQGRVGVLAPRTRLLACALCAASLAGCVAAGATRHPVVSGNAPAAIGPYSQAVMMDGVLYVSGQLGLDAKTGRMAAEDIQGQSRQVLDNLRAIVTAAGMVLDDTVQVQVFLADMNDFPEMNKVYASYFNAPYPARATVQVARLPRDARIEIALIAVKARATASR